MSVKAKLSFTYDDTPITIELNAESLSALDSLKWLVERAARWIDEGKHIKEQNEQ